MYTLYSNPGSCSTGINILMHQLELDFEVKKPSDVEDYASVSPTKQVPALVLENGSVLTEGAAIALYLLDKHGADKMPDNHEDRAVFLRWLMFNYATLHPAYSRLFTIAFRVDIEESVKHDLLGQLASRVSDTWQIIEDHLEGKKFMMGEEPCILDYLLAVYSSWGLKFPEHKISIGANVKRLINDVEKLPEFQAAYKKENNEFKSAA